MLRVQPATTRTETPFPYTPLFRSDAAPVVTPATGIPAPPGSIGAPLPGVRVRLIDADEHDVRVGDVGEIRVQGPNVFHGYWGDDQATDRKSTRLNSSHSCASRMPSSA